MKISSRAWLGLVLGIAFLAGPFQAAPARAETGSGSPPEILYSARFGGSSADEGRGIAADAAGNAYVTGITRSPDLPVLGGTGRPVHNFSYATDAFTFRLDPEGRLAYSTYFDAPWTSVTHHWGEAIGVDSAGTAWVGGSVGDGDDMEVFLARFHPGPNPARDYIYFLGEFPDWTMDAAVDRAGNAYVTGITKSHQFPLQKPTGILLPGKRDAFVIKVDPQGRLVYVTLLSGRSSGSSAYPLKMAVDPAGQVYLTGEAGADLPILLAAQGAYGGGEDAFVAKLDASGRLVYSTYLGGSRADQGRSIAVDASGNSYVAVVTSSRDFPVTSPDPAGPAILPDLVIAKLDPYGTLLASRRFQGTGATAFAGFALDGAGTLYLARSSAGLDPVGSGPFGADCSGNLVARLAPDLSGVVTSTCLPGPGLRAFTADPAGNGYLLHNAENDTFVTKIRINRQPDCSAAFASPATLWPPDGRLVPVAIRNVIDPEGDPVAITVTGVRQDEPLRGTANAFGIGTPNVSVRADRDGKGDGRVYRLSFMAADPQGASCTGTVTVCVPHDQGRGKSCVDGGGLFSSGG